MQYGRLTTQGSYFPFQHLLFYKTQLHSTYVLLIKANRLLKICRVPNNE